MQKQTRWGALLLCFIVAGIFWFLPVPEGLEPNGVRLLGIFIATIIGIISKALPMGAVALVGLTATIVTGTLNFVDAFSGFDNAVVWLIVAAFFIARGFTKTGLGSRIAYIFVKLLGKRTLGLSYGILFTEFILSPAIPSSTARTGGVIYPIVDSLSKAFGSDPHMGTARRLGSYLITIAAQGVAISGSIFLTAVAFNPLIADFARAQGLDLSWGSWAYAILVPGLISLLLMPLIIYKIYPPVVKKTPHATEFAKEKLAEMGKMKAPEITMTIVFISLLVLWVFGKQIGITSTATALLGLCALLITGVLSWTNDVLAEKSAWETLFWFAALVAMASKLSDFGIIEWLGQQVGSMASGLNWTSVYIILSIFYFYLHYLFASQVAHVVATFPVILAVMVSSGVPAGLAALTLGSASSLFGALTHYASGPAAILYGSHYVPIGPWWRNGIIMSVINMAIYMTIGAFWWKAIGMW